MPEGHHASRLVLFGKYRVRGPGPCRLNLFFLLTTMSEPQVSNNTFDTKTIPVDCSNPKLSHGRTLKPTSTIRLNPYFRSPEVRHTNLSYSSPAVCLFIEVAMIAIFSFVPGKYLLLEPPLADVNILLHFIRCHINLNCNSHP